ncbi:hypothetical protein AHiyo1_39650 [Arthrobacter sp. Hiyo1]|nr:hypothetical protein AHiyo1_39650 [Arthrobacter sp. Hiyo1]
MFSNVIPITSFHKGKFKFHNVESADSALHLLNLLVREDPEPTKWVEAVDFPRIESLHELQRLAGDDLARDQDGEARRVRGDESGRNNFLAFRILALRSPADR